VSDMGIERNILAPRGQQFHHALYTMSCNALIHDNTRRNRSSLSLFLMPVLPYVSYSRVILHRASYGVCTPHLHKSCVTMQLHT
jgi:hypothetical protein